MLLLAERMHNGNTLTQQRVLNEAVVHKGTLARMIELELYIDERIRMPLPSRRIDRGDADGLDGVFHVRRAGRSCIRRWSQS